MIRVLLADDEVMTREAIAALLDLEEDLTVVTQVPNGVAAAAQAAKHTPDVALVDVEMPGGGVEALQGIARTAPNTKVCMLTRHARPGLLRFALEAGAMGFVAKSSSVGQLADIVRRVAAGERYVDPFVAAEALAEPRSPLTPQETAILRLVEQRVSTSQIADSLHLARGTVRNYLSTVMAKLNAQTRHEAATTARESGWL